MVWACQGWDSFFLSFFVCLFIVFINITGCHIKKPNKIPEDWIAAAAAGGDDDDDDDDDDDG